MFLASPDIIIATRQLYSASEIVTRLLGQLKVDKGLAKDIKTATNVDYIDDIYIDDIRSSLLPTLPDE